MTRSNDKEMVEMNRKLCDIVQADYKVSEILQRMNYSWCSTDWQVRNDKIQKMTFTKWFYSINYH
jgi:hypothetical protein